MTISWTERAYSDLEGIYLFVANDDEDVAADVCSTILEAIERLATFPHLGKRATDYPKGTHRLVTLPILVFYRVLEDVIIIDALFYGGRTFR